jgi:hypothetical protein
MSRESDIYNAIVRECESREPGIGNGHHAAQKLAAMVERMLVKRDNRAPAEVARVTWRKEPPTVEEVTEHEWWWNSGGDGCLPHVMQLDVLDGLIIHEGYPLVPADWPGDWARCSPPIDSDRIGSG